MADNQQTQQNQSSQQSLNHTPNTNNLNIISNPIDSIAKPTTLPTLTTEDVHSSTLFQTNRDG
jgi:hypothetical protein